MKEKNIKNSILLSSILTLVIGVIFYQVAVSANSENDTFNLNPVVRPIPTALVEPYVQAQSFSFPGHVQARSRVNLAFNVAGKIIEMDVVEGAPFKKGDVLAKLDQRDFEHNYAAAAASASKLAKEFQRIERLLKQEVVSQAEYDTAKSSNDVAQAQLNITKKALDDTIIRAPFDGVVAKRYAENFQHIKENENIFSFKDIAFVEVAVEVPERIVARTNLKGVAEVEVSFDADRKNSYPATIREFSLQPDIVTRTYTLVVAVIPPEKLNILPGMTATVEAHVASIINAEDSQIDQNLFTVPIEAVFEENSNSYCWIVPAGGGNPEKRQVELGVLHNGGIVLHGGVVLGENVATAGLSSLHESLFVRPLATNWEGLDG